MVTRDAVAALHEAVEAYLVRRHDTRALHASCVWHK
jgi:hypothetical protein